MNEETRNKEGDPRDQELGRIWAPQARAVTEETDFADTPAMANLQDDGPAKIWMNVPDGSVLELSVAPKNPFAAAVARLSTIGGKVEVWPHQDISPGPKIRPLASTEEKYVLSIVVAFDGDDPGKVGILARAVHQGATVNTYFHVVGGARGDIKLSRVLIDMQ